jgi:hypothetical protein
LASSRSRRPDRKASTSAPSGDVAIDEALGPGSDAADDAPHERGLGLALDPWVEVIRDERELEAVLLGQPGVADQVERWMLLAGERIADVDRDRPIGRG